MTNHDSTNHLEIYSSHIPVGTVVLSTRQQEIADLLLQGCGNAEISDVLRIKRRTVKAHFNRLFLRFGISDGIKRVKLATLLYRSQLALEANAANNVLPTTER
jgi:DNA-binding NarL/FixJ family response regulator